MSYVIFTASYHNFGMIRPGGWVYTDYTLYDDGLCEYARYSRPSLSRQRDQSETVLEYGYVKTSDGSYRLTDEAMARLLRLLREGFCAASTHKDARDGRAWRMCWYDPSGNAIHEQPLGYIYGDAVLEEIAGLLRRR